MDFHDALSADLPAPRDDETESLREDILAEIQDHLRCAYRRELLRGVDRTTAKQRALDQFGDPAAMARRLWLDAMRGRIMSRRVLVVLCVLLVVACMAMAGLMSVQATRAQREAAMAHAQLAHAMQRAQEVQAKLDAMSKAAGSAKSPEQGSATKQ
jgi:hypothetical protein